eukprot:IDg10536t1
MLVSLSLAVRLKQSRAGHVAVVDRLWADFVPEFYRNERPGIVAHVSLLERRDPIAGLRLRSRSDAVKLLPKGTQIVRGEVRCRKKLLHRHFSVISFIYARPLIRSILAQLHDALWCARTRKLEYLRMPETFLKNAPSPSSNLSTSPHRISNVSLISELVLMMSMACSMG